MNKILSLKISAPLVFAVLLASYIHHFFSDLNFGAQKGEGLRIITK